jgi:hypothetical protein
VSEKAVIARIRLEAIRMRAVKSYQINLQKAALRLLIKIKDRQIVLMEQGTRQELLIEAIQIAPAPLAKDSDLSHRKEVKLTSNQFQNCSN